MAQQRWERDARGRVSVVRDPSHPFLIGETVTVLRLPRTAAPLIEGRAVVQDVADDPHCYHVRFSGDPAPRLRTVHPEYQRDPERMLEILLDLWRTSESCRGTEGTIPVSARPGAGPSAETMERDAQFAEDLLRGAKEIGQFLFGDREPPEKVRRKVYHLAATSHLPVFKLGSMIWARKSAVQTWIQAQEKRHGGQNPKQVEEKTKAHDPAQFSPEDAE